MKFLIRYWYLILMAFLLSLVSAVAVLYLERDKWIATEVSSDAVEEDSAIPGMSEPYARWNYEISGVEDLRVKLEAEREEIEKKHQELEVFKSQVAAEVEELKKLRVEIESLRKAVNEEFIEIQTKEEANIKRLSKVYSEMKPDAAVAIFSDLEMELVVKIISQMKEESASRVLAEMSSSGPDSPESKRAAKITELIQKVM